LDYDLLIKNGRVADGSGMPAYAADLGVKDGKIAEIGRLDAPAARTIDATGKVVAPGFIDNHCHFDAQVTWDPLCTFSPQHGVTTVIFGNCSLGLAPARPEEQTALAMMLSRVEDIPMQCLEAGVQWTWESVAEYLDAIDRRLGVNAGVLMGHSAVRRYVMGEASHQRPEATVAELDAMKEIIRDGIRAGALGLSFGRNANHRDVLGRPIPGVIAPVDEIYDLASALRGLASGVLQCGSAYPLEIREGFATRMSDISGRPVVYNQITYNPKAPDAWKEHLRLVEEHALQGYRVYPVTDPRVQPPGRFTLRNFQGFDSLPTWRKVMIGSTDEEKKAAFSDPARRTSLRAEVDENQWRSIVVKATFLEKNHALHDKSVATIASEQGKDALDALLDLALEEDLNTSFAPMQEPRDEMAATALLQSPHVLIGLSDAGAHVQGTAGYGYGTTVLGYWVRERQALSLEEAIRKLTFMQASVLGIANRGLLWPSFAADIVVFDADTIGAMEPEDVHDLPGGGTRLGLEAQGIDYTIVNGQVLLDQQKHTGAYPGQVVRGGSNHK
jgi:N-acyl-D-amino-acid deacylase